MALILNNQELESAIDMPSSVEALYGALKAYHRNDAARRPRIDVFAPTPRAEEFACFSSMEGIVRGGYYAIRIKPDIISWPEIAGVKRRVTYCSRPGLYGGLILVFKTENAELAAIMNDGFIQHMRVGATAALGARYLARADAATVGVIGSGGMARSFALGFAAVRKLKKITAYSPNPEHLKAYCEEMRAQLDIDVAPAKSVAAAVRGADIVATCTNSMVPVLDGRLLEPGMFLANVTGRELDAEAARRIDLIGYLTFPGDPLKLGDYSDANFEIRADVMAYVAGQPGERERIPGGRKGEAPFRDTPRAPCLDWETEKPLGRRSDSEIAILSEMAGGNARGLASGGIQGIQFAAIAGRAFELAAARGLGKALDPELFLQDIPT